MEQNQSQCHFCQSLKKPADLETYAEGGAEYTLKECPDCKVEYWTPFKNPGREWYEKDTLYAARNIDPDLEANWHQKKTIGFLSGSEGKLLDIGCGAGTFVYAAIKAGWDGYGIDFDRDGISTAKKVFGLQNVFDLDLIGFRLKFPDLKFNLITFFDLFEHIDNHTEFLKEVSEALSAGGYIAMSMPYRRGANWLKPKDFPPRHLTRWDRSTITRYLENNGFKVVYINRLSEGPTFLMNKLRRKYAKYVSFNIVAKMKNKVRKEGKIELGSRDEKKISRVHTLAKIKDWLIFGLPAIIIYLAMLLTAKRYITLFVIARKNE